MNSPSQSKNTAFDVWADYYRDDLKKAYERLVTHGVVQPNAVTYDRFLRAVYENTTWPVPDVTVH